MSVSKLALIRLVKDLDRMANSEPLLSFLAAHGAVESAVEFLKDGLAQVLLDEALADTPGESLAREADERVPMMNEARDRQVAE